MNLATVIATICLILVVSLALRYIIREKRRGSKCIGCPYAEGCSGKGNGYSVDEIVEQCKKSIAESGN